MTVQEIPKIATKVLLIDVDSTIPNLALMKLSAWHKAQGDQVGFNIMDPDLIYASVIFKANSHLTDGLGMLYPNAKIEVGGTGIMLHKKLRPEIEDINPDYSLYPEMDYSLGHTSRGCVRNCYFCVVPKKEGAYRRYKHPSEWVQHDKAVLLDNNWYADKAWFMETSQWFIDHDIKIDATQGLDIRLLDAEIAGQLKKLKWINKIHFAFDDDSYYEEVKRGIQILKDAGINVRGNVLFYVYCDSDEQHDNAANRADQLRNLGVQAMIMFNIDKPRTQRIKDLYRWSMPWIYWSCPYSEYKQKVKA